MQIICVLAFYYVKMDFHCNIHKNSPKISVRILDKVLVLLSFTHKSSATVLGYHFDSFGCYAYSSAPCRKQEIEEIKQLEFLRTSILVFHVFKVLIYLMFWIRILMNWKQISLYRFNMRFHEIWILFGT
jgi:hypothetical protein